MRPLLKDIDNDLNKEITSADWRLQARTFGGTTAASDQMRRIAKVVRLSPLSPVGCGFLEFSPDAERSERRSRASRLSIEVSPALR